MGFGYYITPEHFGLGLYATRVRSRVTGHVGVKISLYFTFIELYIVIDMGDE